jgi:hypothetical protein
LSRGNLAGKSGDLIETAIEGGCPGRELPSRAPPMAAEEEAQEVAAAPASSSSSSPRVVADVLDVDRVALLIHGLTASPDVPVSAATVAERIAAAAAAGGDAAAAAQSVAEALIGVLGDGSGEADPSVLACGMALLADATPNERLKLAFQACDSADSGFVTVHQLSFFIKAFSGVLVAAVECILAATGTAMGAPDPSAQMALLRDTMPTMKATVASLSRSAKELWSPHGIGVADFRLWALANHSVAVWVNRLAGVWAGPILRFDVSTPRMPAEALPALKQAEPLLSAPKLTELLSQHWPGNAAALRDRMFVMHAPEDGVQLQKKEASVSLVLLLENLEAPLALEAIAEMQQSADAEKPMEGVTVDGIVQAMSTLSHEVADGLLVCCSLLVSGRPRGGVSRQHAFELLDPPLKDIGDRVSGAVLTAAIDGASGEMTAESFTKAVSSNADLAGWVKNLQSNWPSLAMLYSSTFCKALRVRHAARRGLSSAGGSVDGAGSPHDKDAAASKIQAFARGSTYRSKMKSASKGAVMVQSFWRMLKAKKEVDTIKGRREEEDTWEKERRQRIERLHRNEAEMMAMKQVPADAVETWSLSRRIDSIVAIQAAARGRAVRRTMPQRRMELQQASAVRFIQKCVRRWMAAPKADAGGSPSARSRREGIGGKIRPRMIAKMGPETIATWQNVIHNRRKTRPRPGSADELWAMRRKIQDKVYDRSLRRMEFEERNAARERLLRNYLPPSPPACLPACLPPLLCLRTHSRVQPQITSLEGTRI